ncbi:MAG: glycosyltransferase [Spirochaetia bacterium]|nr:glycosyltransferase [Spirochaetia bacterium]
MKKNAENFSTSVLFLTFNRLETTKKVFEEIKKAKPPRLYIASDGPRKEKPDEDETVKAVRDYILSNIDWDCDVKTLFRRKNLGCKIAVSTAIDWFFKNEEMGIILEDDCLPNQSFFRFCEELLERYTDDERIMMVCGTNMAETWNSEKQNYHFSIYGSIWGWASWRRAWQHYDVNINLWGNSYAKQAIKNIFNNKKQYNYRKRVFEKVYRKNIDTWDYQWSFARMINSGLTIVPSRNLVSNIGFGENATHTTGENAKKLSISQHDLLWPLKKPEIVVVDKEYDDTCFKIITGNYGIFYKIKRKFVFYLRKIRNLFMRAH